MTLAAAAIPLAAYTIAFQTIVFLALPSRLRISVGPLVIGGIGAALVLAAGALFGFETIGLGATDGWTALLWGLGTVLAMSIVGTAMITNDKLRPQLADPRISGLGRGKALVQIFVRIPVLTALIEEAFFRGLLHSALIALVGVESAVWIGAGLFGMWHIGPGIDQAQAAGKSVKAGTLHTLGTVVATTVAGAFLVWLRVETGTIWAPFAVHAGINMTMALFARAAGRRLATAA